MRVRISYTRFYALWVDGEKTEVELMGTNKSEAYKMLGDQWRLTYPDQPCPPKRRCRLEKIEEVRNG